MKVAKNISFVFGVILGFVIINAWISFVNYNLFREGVWDSTKTKLGKGVWGGRAMVLTNSGLKGGQLNINAWHGNQEITLRKAVQCRQVKFEYHDTKGTPFAFIINKTDSFTTGVIFNTTKGICWYIANNAGKFLYKSDGVRLLAFPQKGTVRAVLENDSAFIYLESEKLITVPFRTEKLIRPGFRGGANKMMCVLITYLYLIYQAVRCWKKRLLFHLIFIYMPFCLLFFVFL